MTKAHLSLGESLLIYKFFDDVMEEKRGEFFSGSSDAKTRRPQGRFNNRSHDHSSQRKNLGDDS